MIAILLIITIIGAGTFIFLNTERFGKHPSGERLLRIEQSPNYKNGSFQNINESYLCKVLLYPHKRIHLEYISGPFEYLEME